MNENERSPKKGMKYFVIALVLGLMGQSGSVDAQNLIWAQGFVAQNARIMAITADGEGNSYVSGSFSIGSGSVILDQGETNETTLTSDGNGGMFVAKYASSGSLLWIKQTTEGAFSTGIAVDDSGHTYVTGDLFSLQGGRSATTTIFGVGEPNETVLVSEPSTSCLYVAKYAPSGDLVWAKKVAMGTFLRVDSIAVDASGHSYVTGQFDGDFSPAVFGPGKPNETALTSGGQSDIFVAKYALNGDLVWAKQAGGAGRHEFGLGIGVDDSGYSYVTGSFISEDFSPAVFGRGEPNETALTSASASIEAGGGNTFDIFVAKYAPNGDLVWAKRAGGDRTDFGFDIAVQGSGHSYVTGQFDVGVFVGKYAPNGDLVWAKQVGGGSADEGKSIAVDGAGNSYVTGEFLDSRFGDPMIFGAGEPNETSLTIPQGGKAIFVAKYASNGTLAWAKRVGEGRGFGINNIVEIAVDGAGHSYVMGPFEGPMIFGFGEPNETTLNGSYFLAMFSASDLPSGSQVFPGTDLNGDGKADLVWRNSGNGATALWLMNGAAIGSFGFPGGVPLIWQIAGVGDVNGDGKADVIWRHGTSGTVAVWVMNGLRITAVGFPGSAPTNWSIQGVGDVNGDGKADLVWRNTADGNTAVWVMNGALIGSSSFLGGWPLTWQIAGVGDVNGDGKADVIWRNGTSGAVAVWVMNGAAIGSIGFPGSASTDLKIAGIGDVNGDGKVDLVWHNTSDGNMEIWLLNGKSIASTGTVDGKILVWKIAKVGDVDGDGRADVIWRNSNTGALDVWLLNGISITSTRSPGAPSPNWELQGSFD